LVTGCAGFIGSWVTAGLVAAGADVVGLIRDQVPNSMLVRSGTIDQITVIYGDVSDYPLLERILAEYEIDTVYHLAAQTIVGIANRAPLSTFKTNVMGTWVLLEAVRRVPTAKRVIVASSNHAYGDQPNPPYLEESPLQGRRAYDVSKSCADLIAQAFAHSYEMPLVVTRFANIYGGGDLHWNRIVPGTIRSVLHGESPIIRSDGTSKRDYLFVQDAVSGYLTIGERLHDPLVCGHQFNFGMETPTSVLEMVQTIISLSEYPNLKPKILNENQNEIPDQFLASMKARRVLGWRASRNLSDGLEETIAWYRNFLTHA